MALVLNIDCTDSDLSNEVCRAEEAVVAAMEGYFVPDGEADETEEKQADESTILLGDSDKLSSKQKDVILRLEESVVYSRIKLKQCALSFSGASVYFYTPIRRDGTPMPSSVLKLDTEDNVRDEIDKTNMYAPLFGLTTPKVKDVQYLPGANPDEPCAVMQIDLCGGLFGLPEFASAPPVHTLASVIQTEMETRDRKVDVVPIINEALERRLHAFSMSSRSVKSLCLADSYKLTRFVGHGVLNRAEEGAKRAKKSVSAAAGFLNPVDIDELDPEGTFMQELTGTRKTVKEFFTWFVSFSSRFDEKFQRRVVTGLCHGDMHGGNLLLDSQGLVWLIDFATVKDNVHILMDLSKFLASCLFLYLGTNITEAHVHTFAKVLFTTPDATTALPLIGGDELKKDATAGFVLELLARLRHCMCAYEIGDDAPPNDGTPFALALFSWSVRMLSYNELSLAQKSRALYFSLAGAQRVLSEIGVDVGPVASDWMNQFRQVWEGQKGCCLNTSAAKMQIVPYQMQVAPYDFHDEFPRFLAQVGTAESWTTDFLTREKLHATDHAISVDVKSCGRLHPRFIRMPPLTSVLLNKLRGVYQDYLPDILKMGRFHSRLLVVGDSGTGKTMLTRQLFSEAAQRQLVELYGADFNGRESAADFNMGKHSDTCIIPVRVPLIDIGRMLEAEPDACLDADPKNDLLARWLQKKYGQDSIPYKLVSDARQACLRSLNRRRRPSLSVGENPVGFHPVGVAEPTTKRSFSSDGPEFFNSGLFLLLDALDEASSFKTSILAYIESLLTSEPGHVVLITSRPANLGVDSLDKLAELGFNSLRMSALSDEQSQEIVQHTLQRVGDDAEAIEAVIQDLMDPGYKALRENPLILTLLTHVLRKHRQMRLQRAAADEIERPSLHVRREIMKKTEVYQRAVRLMLHQSDAAKFALRDGRNDRSIVRRLEMLKSARARKLFQSIAWYGHTHNDRALTWEAIDAASDDQEMKAAFRTALEEGRLPLFELVPVAGQEPLIQMVQLSFQELMTGEYTSAIIRHAHASQKTRAYMNFLLSSSQHALERDRLSQLWWVQVWFHLCEMLHPSAFEEWCSILAEDERAKIKVGSICYFHAQGLRMVTSNQYHAVRFWQAGHAARVTSVDWERQQGTVCEVRSRCGLSFLPGIGRMPITFSGLLWPADGVVTVFIQAVKVPHLNLMRKLMQNGVHYGCVDEFAMHALTMAYMLKQYSVPKLLFDFKADSTTWTFPAMHTAYLKQVEYRAEMLDIVKFSPSGSHLREEEPYGVLLQSKLGTLKLGNDVDPNFKDPKTGATPLMYAAAYGQKKLVKELLEHKASVTAETWNNCTALTFACENSHGRAGRDCVELLIAARSDATHQAGWQTEGVRFFQLAYGRGDPLGMQIALKSEFEKLELLLNAGYSVNQHNTRGQTPMWKACWRCDLPFIQRLLDAKSEFVESKPKMDPLCFIPKCQHMQIQSYFHNWTCAHNALASPQIGNVLSCFLENKLDPNMTSRVPGIPFPISYLLWSAILSYDIYESDDASICERLLEAKADINMWSSKALNLRMGTLAALFVFNTAGVQFFLNNGANVNARAWGLGNFVEAAAKVKNKVAVDTYNDWLLMQSSKEEDTDKEFLWSSQKSY